MSNRKGKNKGKNSRKPVKEIQQAAKELGKADFTKHLNEGLEDPQYPHQKGTMEGFFKDVGDEIGLLVSEPPTGKPEYGMLVLVALVVAAVIISFAAIV